MAGSAGCLPVTGNDTAGGTECVTGRRAGRDGDAAGGPVTSNRWVQRMTVAAGPPAGVLLSTQSMQLTSCDAKRRVMPGEEAAHGSDQPPTCTRQGGPQPPERRWSWRAGEAGTHGCGWTRQRSDGDKLLHGDREVERGVERSGRGRQLFRKVRSAFYSWWHGAGGRQRCGRFSGAAQKRRKIIACFESRYRIVARS
jgi:hypothetical protein